MTFPSLKSSIAFLELVLQQTVSDPQRRELLGLDRPESVAAPVCVGKRRPDPEFYRKPPSPSLVGYQVQCKSEAEK